MNRDVCDRCGKVTRDGDVHTCTPRQDEQEPVAWRQSIEGIAQRCAAEIRARGQA